ncbi:hypothetical protein EDD16DRAFT_1528925 [Pisolithus croceorrhizus]|nr:hypothetical protein EDD16DRAFT_1528925 [Pisolithus croceorrhizus]KAI6117746.1 hypothetical protein EV401DRAFT_1888780 [Pisolithus croceorrhizus]
MSKDAFEAGESRVYAARICWDAFPGFMDVLLGVTGWIIGIKEKGRGGIMFDMGGGIRDETAGKVCEMGLDRGVLEGKRGVKGMPVGSKDILMMRVKDEWLYAHEECMDTNGMMRSKTKR